MTTVQGALCETRFGTLRSRNSRRPLMPTLPTTSTSAFSRRAPSPVAPPGAPPGAPPRGRPPAADAGAPLPLAVERLDVALEPLHRVGARDVAADQHPQHQQLGLVAVGPLGREANRALRGLRAGGCPHTPPA